MCITISILQFKFYLYRIIKYPTYSMTNHSYESESLSVLSDFLRPHGLYSPWNSLDQNTRVDNLSLFQRIFPTQGSNPRLLHCRWILYQLSYKFSSVQFSRSVVSDSLRPHESEHARTPCPSPSPVVHSDWRPSSPWCHPAISSSVVPSPPAFNLTQHQGLFQWVNSLHEVAKVLEFQL